MHSKFLVFAASLLALVELPGVLATHIPGDKCTTHDYHFMNGCSSDACYTVQCLPAGDDYWTWKIVRKCGGKHDKCNNGQCNSRFDGPTHCHNGKKAGHVDEEDLELERQYNATMSGT